MCVYVWLCECLCVFMCVLVCVGVFYYQYIMYLNYSVVQYILGHCALVMHLP